MKTIILKTMLGLVLLLSPTFETIASKNVVQTNNEEKVYICTGSSSKRYHKSSSCRGLKRCSGEIIRVSKSDAIERGKTPCRICY